MMYTAYDICKFMCVALCILWIEKMRFCYCAYCKHEELINFVCISWSLSSLSIGNGGDTDDAGSSTIAFSLSFVGSVQLQAGHIQLQLLQLNGPLLKNGTISFLLHGTKSGLK